MVFDDFQYGYSGLLDVGSLGLRIPRRGVSQPTQSLALDFSVSLIASGLPCKQICPDRRIWEGLFSAPFASRYSRPTLVSPYPSSVSGQRAGDTSNFSR